MKAALLPSIVWLVATVAQAKGPADCLPKQLTSTEVLVSGERVLVLGTQAIEHLKLYFAPQAQALYVTPVGP